ncbi:hypothetical protein AB3662_16225 [Sorangium cellulosum]|uniref:hypothetical protein n=1 Tax=Sorangium cellulosum TaxID=56 RepID=UPI003D9AB31A
MVDAVFNEDEKALLAQVPGDGTAIGNISLRRSLGWSQSRYDLVRDGLIDRGVIGIGKGQGGSVWLVMPHIRLLLLSVPPDGSFTTRSAILKRTGWSDDKFAAVANIAIHIGLAQGGPRNNLALILTPEVEEFLLQHALGADVGKAFDAAKIAAELSWNVNRIYEVRADFRERAPGSKIRTKRRTRTPQAPPAPQHDEV